MIESAVAYVQTLILQHGVLGVLAATLIEEIVAPIPSAIVPLAAGFALIPADSMFMEALIASLTLVAPAVMIGIGIGSAIVYSIAYWGGKPAIDRFGRLLGTNWEEVEHMRAKLTGGKADELVLFGLRLLPIIPGVAISAMCGTIRYPFKGFMIATLAGSYLRAAVLGVLGWQAGALYTQHLQVIDEYERYILIALVAVIALFILWRVLKKPKSA